MCRKEGNGNHDFISWNLIMAFCVICDSACLSFSSAMTGPLKHKRPKTLTFWCSKDMTGYDYILSWEREAEAKWERDGTALINSNAEREPRDKKQFVHLKLCMFLFCFHRSRGLLPVFLDNKKVNCSVMLRLSHSVYSRRGRSAEGRVFCATHSCILPQNQEAFFSFFLYYMDNINNL